MKSGKPLLSKLTRLIRGVLVEDRHLVHEALAQAHALTILQVDSRVEDHRLIPF